MGTDKKSAEKTPMFRTDFPRFTRGLLWVNWLCLLLVLTLGILDFWQGQGIEVLKKLPILLAFACNVWMNRQALKNKK